ncbi:hypothetical protein ACIQ7D_24215 [Streptomyces sp. NPDC096310]|uniref:hypothetical protein n=1 Tax=Streptomyces sp. NPDC096310 TaxID=3366082 RepID=UPI00381EB33D
MRNLLRGNRTGAALAALVLGGSGVLAGATAMASAPAASGNPVSQVEAAAQVNGKVTTNGGRLTVHDKPALNGRDVGSLSNGATVKLDCKIAGGDYKSGTYAGANQFWYKLPGTAQHPNRYVTAQLIHVDVAALKTLRDCP